MVAMAEVALRSSHSSASNRYLSLASHRPARYCRLSNPTRCSLSPEGKNSTSTDSTHSPEPKRSSETLNRKSNGSESLFSASPSTLYSSAAAIALIAAEAAEGSETSYSQASYYTSLGLFILSLPGVYSLIKRSAKSKIVRKTFLAPGPQAPEPKTVTQLAGEITSYFLRNNYIVADRGEVATFKGVLSPSRSQAAFLVFCTALSLASLALVLTVTAPFLGENWYWLTALSPLSGAYYWTKASRTEEIKVKMVLSDDKLSTDVIVQGDDEEIDRMRKELQLMEKGMIYVKGIFEM